MPRLYRVLRISLLRAAGSRRAGADLTEGTGSLALGRTSSFGATLVFFSDAVFRLQAYVLHMPPHAGLQLFGAVK